MGRHQDICWDIGSRCWMGGHTLGKDTCGHQTLLLGEHWKTLLLGQKRQLRTPNIVIGRRRRKTTYKLTLPFHLENSFISILYQFLSDGQWPHFQTFHRSVSRFWQVSNQNSKSCKTISTAAPFLWQFWHIPWIKLGSIWIGSWSRSRVSRVAEVWQ